MRNSNQYLAGSLRLAGPLACADDGEATDSVCPRLFRNSAIAFVVSSHADFDPDELHESQQVGSDTGALTYSTSSIFLPKFPTSLNKAAYLSHISSSSGSIRNLRAMQPFSALAPVTEYSENLPH